MEEIHLPVLLEEVIHWLAPVDGGIYVDANLGMGGHSAAILKKSSPSGRVIGFDWDKDAIELARVNLAPFGSRVTFVRSNFIRVKDVLGEQGIKGVNGLLLDLGLSSLQLDRPARGFSFREKGFLDMRMDDRTGVTAADLINGEDEAELADLFYYYGGERQARRIASYVVKERRQGRIVTTDQLADLVARAIPKRFHPKKIHVATRVFQALRIAVNRELENLEKILADVTDILLPRGRVCIISFHSLEDRLVKRVFRDNADLQILTRKVVTPGCDEIRINPRSRSARLRVAVRQ
ncbi:MAG: 16S rRNA (cytosine(1402)-N(4))-methyltransferase RsmH [Thermodesulfobacteriota bacterium]|nr:16S rRNA (cytosine(1402)-N(4))-methyltransferase RsmH [Thermodesulfobacteriota bacterium]